MRYLALLLCVATLLMMEASAADTKLTLPAITPAQGLAVDSKGNLFFAGSFKAPLDLNPGQGTDLRSPRADGVVNQYIIRVDADGAYKWSQQFGGSTDDSVGNMRMALSNNVLYLATSFSSADAFLGANPNRTGDLSRSVSSQGGSDVAIIALNADTGVPISGFGIGGIVTFGGTSSETSYGILIDSGTVYVSGILQSTNAGFNGPGTITKGAGTGDEVFVLALDAVTGTPRLSFGSGGARVSGTTASNRQAGDLAISGSTLYVAGSAFNTTNDGFVLAMDSTFGVNSTGFGSGGVQLLTGSGSDGATGVAANGNILYVSGGFRSSDFGIGSPGTISNSGLTDGYVAALDATNGSAYTLFGNNGIVTIGGPGGSESIDKLIVSDNVLYCSGSGSTPAVSINNKITDYERHGFFDTYLVALNSFSGAPLQDFGNGDGLISVGDGDKNAAETAQSGTLQEQAATFSFSRDMAVWQKQVLQIGTSNGKSISIDNGGSIAVPAHGFLLAVDSVFDVKPPIVADPNPTRPGLSVSLTVTGPVAAGAVTWSFDDGTPNQFGNPVTHVFNGTVDTTFTATASSVGGTLSLPIVMLTPNVPNEQNVGNGVKVTEPINLLSLTLDRSEGGVLDFLADSTLLRGTNEDVITKVTLGNDASVSFVRRAIYKARTPGIAVATTVAKNVDDQKGRVRKMVAVSAREIGGSNPLPMAPDKTITVTSLTGKFLFTSEKPDAVAFKGTILLPAGLDLSNPNGIEVFVGVGNVVDRVVVSSKGKASLSDFKIVKKASVKFPKLKDTTITASGDKATVQVQFSLSNLDKAGFDTEGITTQVTTGEQGAKSVLRTIQLALVVGGVSYEAPVMVDYKLSKKADSGQFKGRRVTAP